MTKVEKDTCKFNVVRLLFAPYSELNINKMNLFFSDIE